VGGILLSALWTRLVSLSWDDALMIAPTFAVASALCASGSLAMARRALRGGDVPHAELTDREKQRSS
jgi:hypothetical protein